MKCKINKVFSDKVTKEVYIVGETKDFTKERIKEIQDTDNSFIEVLKKEDKNNSNDK